MVSIRLKFRSASSKSKMGRLYYQIIIDRKSYRINTEYRIACKEWSREKSCIIIPEEASPQQQLLRTIQSNCQWELKRLKGIAAEPLDKAVLLSTLRSVCLGRGVLGFLHKLSKRLHLLGRVRASEALLSSTRSFMRFRAGIDMGFERFDSKLMEEYEAYLAESGVSRNTASFYMRNLRAAYHTAVDEGLTADQGPFKRVYTGVDKTKKRAIGIGDVKLMRDLDLSHSPRLQWARDMYLFSFYTQGMPFVDMAYLRKDSLLGHTLTYRRHKTQQHICIEWLPQMQEIVSRYTSGNQYLLPIIVKNGDERKQYQTQLNRLNRYLKVIGRMIGLPIPLTSYTSRHGWATIARECDVPISVISQGLGHDNEKTTRIYLDSIKTLAVHKANRRIMGRLMA